LVTFPDGIKLKQSADKRAYFFLVDVTMMYLGLSLGVVLAVLGAIVGAIIRKRRQLSSKMADAERSNRLTQLRFVREAF